MSGKIAGTAWDREEALAFAVTVVMDATAKVLSIYAQDFNVEYKAKDDPVTDADRQANAIITAALAVRFPGMPIVAEESDPSSFAGFELSPSAWFVDPLDGTRDFVAKNGEFAVMVGLAELGRPTLGVVALPAARRLFAGAEGAGAFELDAGGGRRAIGVSRTATMAEADVVVTRSRRTPEAVALFARLGARQIIPTGSAGVKGVKIACGEADLYVQPPGPKRWDSCAPEAIVRAAGGCVTDLRGEPIDYRSSGLTNEHGVLMSNSALHEGARSLLGYRA